MHSANASAPDPPAPGAVEPELVALARVAVLDPAVVAEPLAALDAEVVGLPELPPHPVTGTPLTSAATASMRACRERVSWAGWTLSCMWAPSGVLAVCASVLRVGRFRLGFLRVADGGLSAAAG
jgi:hypothetical protein